MCAPQKSEAPTTETFPLAVGAAVSVQKFVVVVDEDELARQLQHDEEQAEFQRKIADEALHGDEQSAAETDEGVQRGRVLPTSASAPVLGAPGRRASAAHRPAWGSGSVQSDGPDDRKGSASSGVAAVAAEVAEKPKPMKKVMKELKATVTRRRINDTYDVEYKNGDKDMEVSRTQIHSIKVAVKYQPKAPRGRRYNATDVTFDTTRFNPEHSNYQDFGKRNLHARRVW